MKLVARWLVLAGFAAVTGSCSISHRSGDFACEKQSECSSGRTCIEGFCVASQVDAGGNPGTCPAQCTSCNATTKACTIDCALNNSCAQQVTCPTGWNCNITCAGTSSCRNGITCTGGKSCTIMCSGTQSCQGTTTCGAGPCNVDCSGTGSCRNVNCGPSCACDVACRTGSCATLTCKAPACSTQAPFRGCTSLNNINMCNNC